ncbi:MAG: ABC transporter permease, partial [Albidovulum sp.]
MTDASASNRRIMARIERIFWLAGIGLILAFLYIPIAILVAYGFNDSRSLTWPMSGFTLSWYEKLAANSQLIEAFFNSLYVAFWATTLTLIIGVPAAIV